jgi:hypothetical protein
MISCNNWGQLIEYVKNFFDNHIKYEEILKNYVESIYDINIIKKKNPYKHYEFSPDKVHKIEYKGLYYSLNQNENTATKMNKSSIIIMML